MTYSCWPVDKVLCLCEVGMCLHVLCFMLLCVHCCRCCVLSHLLKVQIALFSCFNVIHSIPALQPAVHIVVPKSSH